VAVGRQVFVIVAPEATGPVFVPDVARIGAPVGLHERKEILLVMRWTDAMDGPMSLRPDNLERRAAAIPSSASSTPAYFFVSASTATSLILGGWC